MKVTPIAISTNRFIDVIGFEVDVSPCRREIQSWSGHLVGWFNSESNATYDATGQRIGGGDLRHEFVWALKQNL